MIETPKGLIPRFTFGKLIGAGSFGSVYRAFDNISQTTVAIKRTKKHGRIMSRECTILKSLPRFPYIVQLIDLFYTYAEKDIFQHLVFEYFPMNLSTFIRNESNKLSLKEIRIIMKQILMALEFLHKNQIMHRDLKPENILFDPEIMAVKLCDFGSAKKLGRADNTPYIVSRFYRAPELIFGNDEYSEEIDVWAAGCVFLELFTGKPVFMGKSDGEQFLEIVLGLGPPTLAEFTRLVEKSNVPAKVVTKVTHIQARTSVKDMIKGREDAHLIEELIKSMLSYDPCKRPSARQCLNHAFFKV